MSIAELPLSSHEWHAIVRTLGLSPREADVVDGILHDRDSQEIAARLGLSPRTVRFHLEHVYQKLGVTRRHQIVLRVFAGHLGRCTPGS